MTHAPHSATKDSAPSSLLIVAVEEAGAQQLATDLRAAGCHVVGSAACRSLVRETVRLAPEAVVLHCDMLDAEVLQSLALLKATAPCPVVLACPDPRPALAETALAAGVTEWMSSPVTPRALGLAVALARARFRELKALRHSLEGAQARLEERKWVDRAKGVLMRAQQIDEEKAFALLRAASMHANLRVGEVSRSVTEAAEAAEAVNRAGLLRMLSQRLVKAMALERAGVDRLEAQAMRQDCMARLQATIDQLQALRLADAVLPLRAAAHQSWVALGQVANATDLGAADARAEALLRDAQRLTDALQAASGRPYLVIVNLSGRQRMLSQRVAKQAVLVALSASTGADGQDVTPAPPLADSVAELESALLTLERSPLSSEEIRATLAVARGQWQRLLEGVSRADTRDGRKLLARESEAVLDTFDRLTSLYEHSMQVLLG